jgi:Histidine kinase
MKAIRCLCPLLCLFLQLTAQTNQQTQVKTDQRPKAKVNISDIELIESPPAGKNAAQPPMQVKRGIVTKNNSTYSRATVTTYDDSVGHLPNQFYYWDKLLLGVIAKPQDRIMDIDNPRSFSGEEAITQRIECYGHPVKLILLDTANSRKMKAISFLMSSVESLWLFDQLEVSITIDGKNIANNWTPVSLMVRPQGDYEWAELYNTYFTSLKPGAEAELRIRHSQTKQLLRVVQLARKDLIPFQTLQEHIVQPTQNFERTIAQKDSIQHRLDSFYSDMTEWSAYATKHTEQQLTPTSRLLWFFRKQDMQLPDSSLSFSIMANGNQVFDKPQITGHMLLLDKLESGTHYEVRVWYTMQPENARTYRFHLPPVWYKTAAAYSIVAIVALIAVAGLIIWRLRQKANKAEQLQRETNERLSSIRSQLNPHFLFNALNSIQHLMNKNETEAANTFLSRFAKLLRTTLEPSMQGMIAVKEELTMLEQYLQLEQLRLPFVYNIEVKDMLDIHAIEIPAMLLQPIAENAIKHGLPHTENPRLIITIAAQNKNFIISVANNGKPYSPDSKKGLGLQLVEEKLWIVNKTFPYSNAAIEMHNSDDTTTVTITFKNWLA